MMDELLTKNQIVKAVAYNVKKAGIIWKTEEVQAALYMGAGGATLPLPQHEEFALAVARFQKQHNLDIDGCLGPATFAILRSATQTSPSTSLPGMPDIGSGVPARTGVSNRIIVNGKRIPMPQQYIKAGLTCSNWIDDADAHEDVHFTCKPRNGEVTNIVIHESVTNSVASTVDALQAQGYGVHFMIAPDGHLSCHNDAVTEYLIHGNQLNGRSVGIEVINPYSPKYAKPPFTRTIPATWWTWVPKGASPLYTLPTDAQLKALRALVGWLCNLIPTLPMGFPTKDLNANQKKIAGWDAKPAAKPGPGIVAHSDYSSHADGRYELEFLLDKPAKKG